MVTDIFIDGAETVTVQGSLVRLNMTVASHERDESGGYPKEVRYRLIMTSQAAIEMHRGLEKALSRLTDAGLVARRTPGDEDGDSSAVAN